MPSVTSELKTKFVAFHGAYEYARERMTAQGMQGAVIAVKVWEEALEAVPLTPDELRIYKKAVAMHSVNGGKLFE